MQRYRTNICPRNLLLAKCWKAMAALVQRSVGACLFAASRRRAPAHVVERPTGSRDHNFVGYSHLWPPISRSFWLGSCALEQHGVTLPYQKTLSWRSARHPVGIRENLDRITGRRLLGLFVLDVSDQVAQSTTEHHTNEEDAKDRVQPRRIVIDFLGLCRICRPPRACCSRPPRSVGGPSRRCWCSFGAVSGFPGACVLIWPFLAFAFALSGCVPLASFAGHWELLHSQCCLRPPLSVPFMDVSWHIPFFNGPVRLGAVAVDAVVVTLGLLPLEVIPPLSCFRHRLSF